MRIVSAAEAVASVRSGDQVYVHCAAAAPSVLLDALVARAPELHDVGMVHLHIEGPGPHLAPEMAGHFRHRALFIGPNARAAVNEGRADYVPVFLSDVPHLFDSGTIPLDVGPRERDPARRARLLLAGHERRGDARRDPRRDDGHRAVQPRDAADPRRELHPRRTTSTSPSRSTSRPMSTRPATIGEVERRIGAHVAELVPDGATLQLGIGAIPAATALALGDKHDLGIHTEMFTDAVVDLVEAGVVNGTRKDRNRGKIVTAFLMGTQRLYDFVDDNPMVEMRSVDFTNDTARHPLVPADGRDQLGDRGGPDRPGRGRLDRAPPLLGRRRADGLHPRRGPRAGGPGRSSRCLRRPPAGPSRGSPRRSGRAPASSRRAPTSGRS